MSGRCSTGRSTASGSATTTPSRYCAHATWSRSGGSPASCVTASSTRTGSRSSSTATSTTRTSASPTATSAPSTAAPATRGGLPAAEAGHLQEDRGDARDRRHRGPHAGRPSPGSRHRVVRGPVQLDQEPLPHPPARLSPPEVQHISRRSKLTVREMLSRLRDAGLDSLPGGGGEVLVDRVRDIIAPKKTNSDDWLDVMRHAHRLGMSTTATMMFGHVETLEERVEHMRRVRDLQDETGGFRAFISWTFQRDGNRLGAAGARRGHADVVRVPAHAGDLPALPRQRAEHPVVVGDAGPEDRPARPAASAPTTWAA